MILRKVMEQGSDLPAIVTGVFNCLSGSFPYRVFVENGFADTFLAAGNEDDKEASTFHAFKGLRYLLLR